MLVTGDNGLRTVLVTGEEGLRTVLGLGQKKNRFVSANMLKSKRVGR